jgi:hypothetical protein
VKEKHARKQQLLSTGIHPAQFKAPVHLPNGRMRLRFLVYDESLERYESIATNHTFTKESALRHLGWPSFDSAQNEGYLVDLAINSWDLNTIEHFEEFPQFVVPQWAREIQDDWQSRDDNRAKYHLQRLRTDEKYRVACEIRNDTWKLYRGLIRYCPLVGLTTAHLRMHLEMQFRDGMTHENYGKVWEIDHKHALSGWDLTCPVAVGFAAHWTNLQPLTVEENRKKYSKIHY